MKKTIIYISVLGILGYLFYVSFSIFLSWQDALMRSLYGVLIFAIVFYISGEVLAEQFLIKRKKPIVFGVFAFLLIVIVAEIRSRYVGAFPGELGQELIHSMDEGKSYYFYQNLWLQNRLSTGRTPILIGIIMHTVVVIIAVLLKLYEYKAEIEKSSREKLQRSQEAQILYLKSQVNPHFLFNTLNNLYGLTYSKSDLAPKMVLGLSETMRYLIYETEQKLVPIQKELDFIRNYLELEKMRISFPENIRVSFNFQLDSVFIPPLLLLPFVENCFKHGTIGKEDDGWMEIDIWDKNNHLFFVCKNSFKNKNGDAKSSGIGLKNVKKRLMLIYNNDFNLKTICQEDEYLVSLDFPVFKNRNEL